MIGYNKKNNMIKICSHEELAASNGDIIEVDEAMAPIISILNLKGYTTEYCCSGHAFPYVDYEVETMDSDSTVDEVIRRFEAKNDYAIVDQASAGCTYVGNQEVVVFSYTTHAVPYIKFIDKDHMPNVELPEGWIYDKDDYSIRLNDDAYNACVYCCTVANPHMSSPYLKMKKIIEVCEKFYEWVFELPYNGLLSDTTC